MCVYMYVYTHTYNFIYLFFGCVGCMLPGGLFSSCGALASHCVGFFCYRARVLSCTHFSSCYSQALQHRRNNCSAQV